MSHGSHTEAGETGKSWEYRREVMGIDGVMGRQGSQESHRQLWGVIWSQESHRQLWGVIWSQESHRESWGVRGIMGSDRESRIQREPGESWGVRGVMLSYTKSGES